MDEYRDATDWNDAEVLRSEGDIIRNSEEGRDIHVHAEGNGQERSGSKQGVHGENHTADNIRDVQEWSSESEIHVRHSDCQRRDSSVHVDEYRDATDWNDAEVLRSKSDIIRNAEEGRLIHIHAESD